MAEFKVLRALVREHFPALSRNLVKAIKKNEYGAIVDDRSVDEMFRFFESVDYEPNHLRENEAYLTVMAMVDELKTTNRNNGFDPFSLPKEGLDFEYWVAESLAKYGWDTNVTKGSGDNGVDIVAKKHGLRVAIQCKLYQGSVGIKAVQEVYAGMTHMQLDNAVVISTGQYTKAAVGLAETTGVLLISEHDIPHLQELLN